MLRYPTLIRSRFLAAAPAVLRREQKDKTKARAYPFLRLASTMMVPIGPRRLDIMIPPTLITALQVLPSYDREIQPWRPLVRTAIFQRMHKVLLLALSVFQQIIYLPAIMSRPQIHSLYRHYIRLVQKNPPLMAIYWAIVQSKLEWDFIRAELDTIKLGNMTVTNLFSTMGKSQWPNSLLKVKMNSTVIDSVHSA